MEKLESDLENFVRLCHLHEKVHNLEQALAEKDLALAQANRHKDELFQKLTEKDREIEAKETELGKLDAELIIRNAAYQQLLERTVRKRHGESEVGDG